MDEDQAFERLMADQKLIRLPLVRAGAELSVGVDEKAWRRWTTVLSVPICGHDVEGC